MIFNWIIGIFLSRKLLDVFSKRLRIEKFTDASASIFDAVSHAAFSIQIYSTLGDILLYNPESIYFKEGKLNLDKEMVLFCAGGLRSALAAKSLKDMGFEKVSHIDGGFAAINQSDFKIV